MACENSWIIKHNRWSRAILAIMTGILLNFVFSAWSYLRSNLRLQIFHFAFDMVILMLSKLWILEAEKITKYKKDIILWKKSKIWSWTFLLWQIIHGNTKGLRCLYSSVQSMGTNREIKILVQSRGQIWLC